MKKNIYLILTFICAISSFSFGQTCITNQYTGSYASNHIDTVQVDNFREFTYTVPAINNLVGHELVGCESHTDSIVNGNLVSIRVKWDINAVDDLRFIRFAMETADGQDVINYQTHACFGNLEGINLGTGRTACEGFRLDAGMGTSYKWFKDGVLLPNDTSRYYEVAETGTYNVTRDEGMCSERTGVNDGICIEIREIQINNENIQLKNTYSLNNVLSVSASTFSDSRMMDDQNEVKEIEGYNNLHEYQKAKRGVWRANESYVYQAEKTNEITENIALKSDGTFHLKMLSWENHPALEAQQYKHNWRKVNTISKYNFYGYELENKDILGRYSGAIYGYDGQLAIAVGANTRNTEMAYINFETEVANGPKGDKGNFNILYSSDYSPKHLTVSSANIDMAVVEAPFEDLRYLSKVNVQGQDYDTKKFFTIDEAIIHTVCKHPDPAQANKSIIVFKKGNEFNTLHRWHGKIGIVKGYNTDDAPIANYTLNTLKKNAHTGSNSLELIDDFEERQTLLQLIPGKQYVMSAWVKVDNTIPDSDNTVTLQSTFRSKEYNNSKLGFRLRFEGASDKYDIEPVGNIIDGWQKVEGTFLYPETATAFFIKLQRGSNNNHDDDDIENKDRKIKIYFDDIRLFPELGNIQTYVYNPQNYRLQAVLDNNNYATLYYYDPAGNLFLVKKETVSGIQTIQESKSYQVKTN